MKRKHFAGQFPVRVVAFTYYSTDHNAQYFMSISKQ